MVWVCIVQGLKWVQDNSGAGGAAETNMMLLSAWNEHDEGTKAKLRVLYCCHLAHRFI